MKNILNDKSKFQEVYIDHDKILNDLIHMKNRVTDVLKNLRHKKEITIEKYYLIPSDWRPGIMYGLAKAHKIVTDDLPSVRHILSAIVRSTYKLSKFLVLVLKLLTSNECPIKDSFTFAKLQSFDSKFVVVTFDIKSSLPALYSSKKQLAYVENLFKDRVHVDNLSVC